MTDGGTYTLLVALPDPATVEVGALGALELQPGWYAYVGSALGSGGFARIDRHRDLAAGDRDTRHWHVDSLLGHPDSRLDSVVRSAGVDAECTIAGDVDGDRIEGFGCSDCSCDSHLRYRPERAPLLASVEDAHERARAAADASG